MGTTVLERSLPASVDAEPEARALLAAALEGTSAPVRARRELELMLEELFVNVARYAYPAGAEDPQVLIRVSADEDAGRAEVTLCDRGVPFDPFDRPLPDRPASVGEAPIGGLGIQLVRRLSDACEYRREDAMNKTRFTKLWGPSRDRGDGRADRDVANLERPRQATRLDDRDLDGVVGGIAPHVPSRPGANPIR